MSDLRRISFSLIHHSTRDKKILAEMQDVMCAAFIQSLADNKCSNPAVSLLSLFSCVISCGVGGTTICST